MKAYNITDVSTPQLEQKGLVNTPIKLGDTMILPGTMRDVHARHRAHAVQRFAGAIALDSLPPGYQGRAKPRPTMKPAPAPPPEEPEGDE